MGTCTRSRTTAQMMSDSEVISRPADHTTAWRSSASSASSALRGRITTRCPAAVPAIRPDVAIVHAQRADREGNAQWDGTSGADVEMVKAAKRVIITCEEIVDRDVIVANAHMTKVPGYYVDAVIEAPFGAHPCSHVPAYGLDAWRIKDYVAATAEGFDAYLESIRNESEADYRKRVVGEDRMPVLRGLVAQAQVLTPSAG